MKRIREEEIFPRNPNKTYGLMELVKGSSTRVDRGPDDMVSSWPHLLIREAALFAALAQAVKDCMRRSDLVARYGERELIALLPHTGATRETVIRRLHARLSALAATFPHPCPLSLGRASFPAQQSRDGLLTAATAAETV